jgi:hypothetical protein
VSIRSPCPSDTASQLDCSGSFGGWLTQGMVSSWSSCLRHRSETLFSFLDRLSHMKRAAGVGPRHLMTRSRTANSQSDKVIVKVKVKQDEVEKKKKKRDWARVELDQLVSVELTITPAPASRQGSASENEEREAIETFIVPGLPPLRLSYPQLSATNR